MLDNETIANPTNKKSAIKTRAQSKLESKQESYKSELPIMKSESRVTESVKELKVEVRDDSIEEVMKMLADEHVRLYGESDQILKVAKKQLPGLVFANKIGKVV